MHTNFTQKDFETRARTLPPLAKSAILCLAVWGYISLSLIAASFLHSKGNDGEKDWATMTTMATRTATESSCDCGETIEEAESKNCIFDALASAWLPPKCRDDHLTAEFNRSGPGDRGAWPYYADENGTIPMTMDEMAQLGGKKVYWYSIREWHVYHCNFYWRKYFRIKDTNALMEKRYGGLHHIRHCNDVFLDKRPIDSIAVHAWVVLNSDSHATAAVNRI